MKVLQIIDERASLFSVKSAAIDGAILDEGAGRSTWLAARKGLTEGGESRSLHDLASYRAIILYGTGSLSRSALRAISDRTVADAPFPRSRFPWLQSGSPFLVTSPHASPAGDSTFVPEAVDAELFAREPVISPDSDRAGNRIGVVCRGMETTRMIETTRVRLERFRDDLEWVEIAEIPTRETFDRVDLWVDPARDPEDLDGGTAEALVAGLPVVAARTPINVLRLSMGECGFLTPPGDPNELAHAILNALFKPEARRPKLVAAGKARSSFHPDRRGAELLRILAGIGIDG